MKNPFVASMAGNALLVAAFIWLCHERPSKVVSSADAKGAPRLAAPQAQPGRSSSWAAAAPAPFHWSQLESTNYFIYIANLRGIGCPEQTIRDLISADVGALYTSRREELQRESLITTGAAFSAGHQKEDLRLQRLRDEESALIEKLLRPETNVQVAGGEVSSTTQALTVIRDGSDQEADQVKVPLFLANPGPGFEFTTEQLEAVNDVRQWFEKQVGGLNQDPQDPEYFRRWQWAQPGADALLRASMGPEAFMRYQVALLEGRGGSK